MILGTSRGSLLTSNLRNRVLRVGFERGGEPEGLVGVQARGGDDVHDAEFTARQRAGLVEDHRREQARLLQSTTIPHEQAGACRQRCGDRDDQRNGETKRVGTRDHENGDEALNRVRGAGPKRQPGEDRDCASTKRDEPWRIAACPVNGPALSARR